LRVNGCVRRASPSHWRCRLSGSRSSSCVEDHHVPITGHHVQVLYVILPCCWSCACSLTGAEAVLGIQGAAFCDRANCMHALQWFTDRSFSLSVNVYSVIIIPSFMLFPLKSRQFLSCVYSSLNRLLVYSFWSSTWRCSSHNSDNVYHIKYP
jgi:hypothetical protein